MLINVKLVYLHIFYIQMTKRTSKEYFITKNSFIKTKYGTLNKHNPEVLYVRSKTKLNALENKKDYKSDLDDIGLNFKKYVKTLINNTNLFNKYICIIETPEKGIVFNKLSHLKYDLYLHPKIIKDLLLYEREINYIVTNANNKLKELCDLYKIELV